MDILFKYSLLVKGAVQVILVICITLLVIHFEDLRLCWWYLLPVFMGPSSVSERRNEDAQI